MRGWPFRDAGMMSPVSVPLRQRLLYSLIPLLVVLVGIEGVSWVVAEVVLASRRPAPTQKAPLPRRAEAWEHGPAIVCVGDSWTFGWGLTAEQSYPGQLQEKLDGVQVLNLGNPGASPIVVARILRAQLQKAPADLVIYLAGSNTPMNRVTIEDKRTPAPLRAARPFLRHFAAYRLLSQLIARARLQDDEDLQHWSIEEEQERIRPGSLEKWTALALQSTRSNMARMADIADLYDVPLLVLTYGLPPSLDRLQGASWYRFPALNEAIRQAAAENQLPVLDMEAAYRERGVQDADVLYYGTERLRPDNLDIHPNTDGYAIYAEEIAAWISQWGGI